MSASSVLHASIPYPEGDGLAFFALDSGLAVFISWDRVTPGRTVSVLKSAFCGGAVKELHYCRYIVNQEDVVSLGSRELGR